MADHISAYWDKMFSNVRKGLEKNGFEVHLVGNRDQALKSAMAIVEKSDPETIGFGGSTTIIEVGLYDALKNDRGGAILDSFDHSLPADEKIEIRRQSLVTDMFFTGSNAITEDGKLVNLDMFGNRVAAIAFGPREVVLIIGRNKIVPDMYAAMDRVKNYAAPVNTGRLDKKTPCVKTGKCHDCNSPDRICNVWVITEKSYPEKRIKIILVNEDLGF